MKTVVMNILKSIKNVVRVIAFLLLVAILLETWNMWLHKKSYDGSLMMETFYAQPENSIDMLIVGSSHTFVDMNTGVLWDEFGIPSFVIGGSLQPFWNSYYYIREALKTQTPNLIVLEALACDLDYDFSEHGTIINNVSGMHMNMNKLESIRASVSDTDGIIDYSLLFEEYHNRYSELTITDVASDLGDSIRTDNWKGFYDYLHTDFMTEPQFDMDVDPIPMTNKMEYYYRQIIEYCQEVGIPLVIVVSPDAGYNDLSRAHYLYAGQIAEEYGVEFIDFNEYYDEIGIDFSYDFGDIGHLNYSGNRKFTSFMGEYIEEHFDMPDRRGDETGLYDSWDENYRYLETRVDNYILYKTFDLDDYINHLTSLNDDYEIFIALTDVSMMSESLITYLNVHGIQCERPYDSRRYLIQGGNTTVLEADENGLYYDKVAGNHYFALTTDGCFYDGWNLMGTNHQGVFIVVYDNYNQMVADNVCIYYEEVWKVDD